VLGGAPRILHPAETAGCRHNEAMVTAPESQALLAQALAPSNRGDPYPHYRALRESGPLRLAEADLTVFSAFADCAAALRHPASASDRLKSTIAQRQIAAGQQPRPFGLAGLVDRRRAPAFLFLDPPDHTRLRKLVSKAPVRPRLVAARPDGGSVHHRFR
jgi:cytochrome P450